MVLPLMLIGIIVLAVVFLLLLPFIMAVLKIGIILGALIAIWYFLPKKVMKKIANWQFIVIFIGLTVAVISLGAKAGFFAIGQLPMAVQEPIATATLSPLNLVMAFIIMVLSIMYIKK